MACLERTIRDPQGFNLRVLGALYCIGCLEVVLELYPVNVLEFVISGYEEGTGPFKSVPPPAITELINSTGERTAVSTSRTVPGNDY